MGFHFNAIQVFVNSSKVAGISDSAHLEALKRPNESRLDRQQVLQGEIAL